MYVPLVCLLHVIWTMRHIAGLLANFRQQNSTSSNGCCKTKAGSLSKASKTPPKAQEAGSNAGSTDIHSLDRRPSCDFHRASPGFTTFITSIYHSSSFASSSAPFEATTPTSTLHGGTAMQKDHPFESEIQSRPFPSSPPDILGRTKRQKFEWEVMGGTTMGGLW